MTDGKVIYDKLTSWYRVRNSICPDQEQFKFIMEEFKKVMDAGHKLSVAASRVQAHKDGMHRLGLAIAEWQKTRADEWGRGKKKFCHHCMQDLPGSIPNIDKRWFKRTNPVKS